MIVAPWRLTSTCVPYSANSFHIPGTEIRTGKVKEHARSTSIFSCAETRVGSALAAFSGIGRHTHHRQCGTQVIEACSPHSPSAYLTNDYSLSVKAVLAKKTAIATRVIT